MFLLWFAILNAGLISSLRFDRIAILIGLIWVLIPVLVAAIAWSEWLSVLSNTWSLVGAIRSKIGRVSCLCLRRRDL